MSRIIFEASGPRGLVVIFWPGLERAVIACPFGAVDVSYAELQGLVDEEKRRRELMRRTQK